jgi:hypothetical protein
VKKHAHLVRLGDGLEPRLCLGLGRMLVGFPFPDEVLVRGANFRQRGVLGEVEDLVVQLGRVPHRPGGRRERERSRVGRGGARKAWVGGEVATEGAERGSRNREGSVGVSVREWLVSLDHVGAVE